MDGPLQELPKAVNENGVTGAAGAPALWNPNAAVCWSFLFPPIFGTWLHMKNWQALGEADHARQSGRWFAFAVIVYLATIALAIGQPVWHSGSRWAAWSPTLLRCAFVMAWYFAPAQKQVDFVSERFGIDYPRQGWSVPLLCITVVWLVGFAIEALAALSPLGG